MSKRRDLRNMDATLAAQRFQEIVSALEHEAVVVGIDGLIYAANEQLAARLGSCTAAQIIGKPLTELLTTARSSLPTRTDAALASSAPRWEALRRLMDSSTSAGSTTLADGAAAQHSPSDRPLVVTDAVAAARPHGERRQHLQRARSDRSTSSRESLRTICTTITKSRFPRSPLALSATVFKPTRQ